MKAEQKILPDATSLITAAAEHFVSTARSAIAKRGVFYVALAGGSTPKGLYEKLATSPYIEQIDWARVHLFFGDERCVPATHDDSNFKMARQAMIDLIPIPSKNVHRMPTESGDAADVAVRYADTMKTVMDSAPFDLVLLGLGPDGHIASLFPETPALEVTDTLTASLYVEKFDSWRVTITYPVINAARQVIVFIAGEAKAAIVKDITSDALSGLPVQRLAPENDYYWFMDKAAAGQ
ncbi:6-phosphogluconolactonase [Methylophaga sulfidovorans]|uniref:6-phosphogluconolactonase n=1 Tax=Methylophaga sulfidovorans TaxID=45496 RepID=A0A1I3XHA5_9GAMM|nr:6-phosphogluconolactonase [Methylophaga sulfidovorans]SFK18967.1 6-phosphogluconolactonase [Methylophaga sulfidovorans]